MSDLLTLATELARLGAALTVETELARCRPCDLCPKDPLGVCWWHDPRTPEQRTSAMNNKKTQGAQP